MEAQRTSGWNMSKQLSGVREVKDQERQEPARDAASLGGEKRGGRMWAPVEDRR